MKKMITKLLKKQFVAKDSTNTMSNFPYFKEIIFKGTHVYTSEFYMRKK